MINSICIVRLSALGDVLMLVPLIRTLQANIPDASITWVISRPAYDLVEGMDGVEFIVINKPNSIADYWRFKKQLKGRFFDVLLATQASFRANLLYPLIRASRKIGFDAHRAKDGHKWVINETIRAAKEHNLEGFLQFAKVLGLLKEDLRWDLPIMQADYEWARMHLPAEGPVLLVNPAASKPERSWPVERYVAVIREAQQRWHAQVVLTGGPGAFDRKLADAIISQVDCIDLVGKTKPKQLLAVISQAKAMLCPDTGPSHMAAAVGTPVVALHAVTNSQITGPYTFRHLVIDCYPQAVETILQKKAKKNAWGTKVHGEEAMKLIQVDAVLAKLDTVMQ
ncbi:glycosyltransferase family 9 protein [Legionella cardiaca]|uniref:Glycosyltransferase family 9 protein n=1 Tax=Legionella cardiaca TaxID=1071983 RepID=A0ABY8APJ2_9GAMM|nr:glycosyltransferase family 9 protein [Legionella cardiaca]WED42458.1 glycosyltransferase family 9 protein [Legionella cardiaca]